MGQLDLRPWGRAGAAALRRPAWGLALLMILLVPAVDAAGKDLPGADKAEAYAWRVGVKKGLEVTGVSCLRIHPKDPGVLWAHVHGLGPARSDDGGQTWLPLLKGIPEDLRPGPRSQVRLTLDPRDEKVIYLVSDGQIYRSTDSGASWTSITSGALASLSWDKLESSHLSWEVRIDEKKNLRLLVGTRNDGHHNGSLHESNDGGKSWEEIAGTALPKSKLGSDTLWVRMDAKTDKVITVAGRQAVYYSDDRGREFVRNDPGGAGIHDIRGVSDVQGKDLYLADARGVWRSKNVGKTWEKKPLVEGDALGVFTDPHHKKRLYVIWYDRGIEMSEDGPHKRWTPYGGAWTPPGDKGDDASAGQPGYVGGLVREILAHPRDKKTVYLASPVTGLHISEDEGETFHAVLPPADLDPDAPRKAVPTLTPPMVLVAVHPARGGAHVAISEEGVVYRSTDRCESWSRVGLLGQAPGVLVPDTEEHAWLAGGRMLLRSADDGATWLPLYPPRDGNTAIDPEASIVAVHRGAAEGDKPGQLRILFDRSGVVMTSVDDGASWRAANPPRAISGSADTWAACMAVDPGESQHLVIAAQTTAQGPNPKDDSGGVFESWDGGATWDEITGALKPGAKDSADQRRDKANWNRARFVVIDRASGLLVYGAAKRGIFVRPFINPKGGEKLDAAPAWVDVTPKEPESAEIPAWVYTITADKTDTRLFVQLRGPNGDARCYDIAGRELKAWYDRARTPDDKEPAPTWNVLPGPGAGVHLTSVAADGQLPGRLVATESESGHGILVFEIPGSKPVEATKPPPKDEPKKDEPKKDEPKKDEPKPGSGVAVQPPEGMRAFSAGQDKTVRVWAVDKGEAKGQIAGHENAVLCIALTPDEAHLLTGSEDRTLRVWTAANVQPVGTINMEGAPRSIAVDDDSKYAYVALGETLMVGQIEIASRAVKTFAGHKKSVRCVATSEDVNRAYSGGDDDVVIVWDTQSGAEVNSIVLGAPVVALAVARDGSRIYAAGGDGSIAAFDASGTPVGRLEKLAAPAAGLALSADGALLYATSDGGVLAIATGTMTVATTHLAPDAGVLTCVKTSADGVWILAGDANGGLWMWARGQAAAFRARMAGHEGALRAVCVTPDETALAVDPSAGAKPPAKGDEPPAKGDEPPAKGDGPPAKGDEAPKKDAPPPGPPDDGG